MQAKRVVGAADDRFERQADQIADEVVAALGESGCAASPLPAQPPAPLRSAVTAVGRIQPKAVAEPIGYSGGALDDDTDRAIRRATGHGAPLDNGVRSAMESGFGADFSGVRIHQDARSDDLNQRIQAKAFTTGSDIFFSRGEYSPATESGQRLLAHELTHIVQQGVGLQRSPDRVQRFGKKKQAAAAPPEIGGPTDVRIGGVDPQQGIANMGYDGAQVRDVSPEARQAEAEDARVVAQTQKHADGIEAWRPVWANIDLAASDADKMDALLANFKANQIGFSYKGMAKPFEVQGDCASQSGTFKIIAESVLGVKGKISYGRQAGSPGWYIAPGVHEVGGRAPNVSDGGYYFVDHTWIEWNGTVYDVLFGEKGQNGAVPTKRKKVNDADYLQVGEKWYLLDDKPSNHWQETADPG